MKAGSGFFRQSSVGGEGHSVETKKQVRFRDFAEIIGRARYTEKRKRKREKKRERFDINQR